MNSVAIITARGGSKRIPKKNIRNFCGKPIIAYSIEAALNCCYFDTVMVSTDDEEIAAVAREYGAEVPFFRSCNTSDDYATTADVLLEVIQEYQKRGKYFDYHCCIYPTAPFITSEKLCRAFDTIISQNAEYVATFAKYSVPPQWRCVMDKNSNMHFAEPDTLLTRSQDLEDMYYDAGQFYIYKTEAFMTNNGNMNGKVLGLVVPETEVQDIDDYDDWKMAEIKYKMMMAR